MKKIIKSKGMLCFQYEFAKYLIYKLSIYQIRKHLIIASVIFFTFNTNYAQANLSNTDCIERHMNKNLPENFIVVERFGNVFEHIFSGLPKNISISFVADTLSIFEVNYKSKKHELLGFYYIEQFKDIDGDGPDFHYTIDIRKCGSLDNKSIFQQKNNYRLQVFDDNMVVGVNRERPMIYFRDSVTGEVLAKYGTFDIEKLYRHCRKYCKK